MDPGDVHKITDQSGKSSLNRSKKKNVGNDGSKHNHLKNTKTTATSSTEIEEKNIRHHNVSNKHLSNFDCEICDCDPCGTRSQDHFNSPKKRNNISTNISPRRMKKK